MRKGNAVPGLVKVSCTRLLADKFNKNPLSKAGFSIAWLQTDRSRNFKMRVYLTFGYVPVYFFFITTQSKIPLNEIWEK
ncbi:MAG: hypothetical protein QM743_13890, partial [Chitinophagaceae bacterium]